MPPGSAPPDLGHTVAGSRVYVLDRWLRPVPPGVVGEICIGGAGVGRGYVGAPGLTAERFVPDPFTPGGRLYRSGDLGRWLPSGRIEPLGRADRQVKVRGFRVETAEVEAVLRGHPEVRDAVVTTASDGEHDDVRLVGYVVGDPVAAQAPAGDLSAYARRFLPAHMVPAVFVALPEVPRTSRGKLDLRALPPPQRGSAAGTPPIAPRTPVERELSVLVADLLGLPDPVGVADNFFALGGHSVKATQLMARIWTAYGVDLPVRTLFDDPTVAGLASAVTAAGATRAGTTPAGGAPAGPGATAGTGYLDTLTDDDVDDLLAGMDQPSRWDG